MTTRPDLYTNVHKGIRKALFDACFALGRAEGDPRRETEAKAALDGALAFVAHHGDNEDALLVPILEHRAPAIAAHMRDAHREIDAHLDALRSSVHTTAIAELYLRACEFLARYLQHMQEEEAVLEAQIRAAVSDEDLAGFARGSVERTPPAERMRLLEIMLPAMPRAEANAMLARLPKPLASELASRS